MLSLLCTSLFKLSASLKSLSLSLDSLLPPHPLRPHFLAAATMSSRGAGVYSRVRSIPEDDLKTVRYIKEITKDHSDEDIFTMLKECSMDPAETIHRLSHLDTFHVVKSKRDKRKEKIYEVPAEPRRRQGYQGRGFRSGRGSGPFRFISQDAGRGRNSAVRREYGPVESREKGVKPSSPLQLSEDADEKTNNLGTKSSSVLANGSMKMALDIPSAGHGAKLLNVPNVSKDNTDAGAEKQSSERDPSASDPVLVPLHNSNLPTPVGAIKREVGMQCVASESAASVSVNQLHLSQYKPPNRDIQQNNIAEDSELPLYKNHENGLAGPTSRMNPGKSRQSETIIVPVAVTTLIEGSSSVGPNGSSVEEETSRLGKLKFSDCQHVIIPNHIQVPDSVKSVLSFGSFGASSDVNDVNNLASNQNSDAFADPLSDVTAKEPSPRILENGSSSQDAPSIVQEGNSHHHPQAQSVIPEKASILESKVPSAAVLQEDQLKPESAPAIAPPYPNVHPSYNFFMPTMLGSPLLQLDGFDAQARLSNFMGVNSQATSTTPPSTQTAGGGQSSVSQHHVSLIRQPYPANFFPYGVFPSLYMPPTPHSFFGQGGFLPQMPAANMYLTPQSAAAGMKVSPASYNQGTNSGIQAPLGMPNGIAIYGSQVGFSPSAAVATGNLNISEDVQCPPSLKENNVYPGKQSEVSAWMQTRGRDASTLPLNSSFNIHPQSGHRSFSVYPPLQPIAAPAAAGHPLMQQSQSIAGSVEPVGPPSNAYQQQPRCQKMNWSSNL